MKVTSIRTHKGKIPSTDTILKLEKSLKNAMTKLGFISDVTLNTRTSIKIGLHMCSFRIDTTKHGHNADYGNCGIRTVKGYRLTSIPTWSQREQFNHMVNDCFDKLKLDAQIKSGAFPIRDKKTGRVNQWSPTTYAYSGGNRLFEIRVLPC